MRKNKKFKQPKFNHRQFLISSDLWLRGLLISGALPLLLVLAACGGGGGGGSDEAVATPPPARGEPSARLPAVPEGWETDREVWADNPQFQAQPGLDTINAQDAYARGITGAGQTIGFVDTGLDAEHEEFAGKDIKLNDRSGLDSADAAQLRHGTGVASIALGARHQGDGMHGVAFDADPAMWSLNLDDGYLDVNDAVLSRGIAALENAGARIINQSWGYASVLDLALIDSQQRFLEGSYGGTLARMRQGNAIHVWAAGNNARDQVSVSSAWPVIFPELAGYSIVVTALGADGAIGRLANRCGAARDHCLAAPGGVAVGGQAYTRMAAAGGGYRSAFGTSYATPYVSGVLALMMQAFGDQLSLPEYAGRLFDTADKSGIYGNRALYGQGLVDADAALTPFGDTHIPLPAGGIAGPAETRITEGDLPGEMIERLKRERIIILDELNAPFRTTLVIAPDKHQSFELTEWMTHGDNKTSPVSHPFLANYAELLDGTTLGPYWTLVPVALRNGSLNDDGLPAGGLGFKARRTRRRKRLELGVVSQEDSFLSSSGEGALKMGNSHSVMMSAGQDLPLGTAVLSVDAHVTVSQAEGDGTSLFRGTRRALASAFAMRLAHGRTQLEIKQPTHFESGVMRLSLPARRLAGGGVVFRERDFSMRASQRPFEISLRHGDAAAGFGLRLQKEAGRDAAFTFGYKSRF